MRRRRIIRVHPQLVHKRLPLHVPVRVASKQPKCRLRVRRCGHVPRRPRVRRPRHLPPRLKQGRLGGRKRAHGRGELLLLERGRIEPGARHRGRDPAVPREGTYLALFRGAQVRQESGMRLVERLGGEAPRRRAVVALRRAGRDRRRMRRGGGRRAVRRFSGHDAGVSAQDVQLLIVWFGCVYHIPGKRRCTVFARVHPRTGLVGPVAEPRDHGLRKSH